MLVPQILKLEVTNRCNARCIICPHNLLDPKLIADMPFETVKRLLDEASTWPQKPRIQLSAFGESTLYPRLVDAVKYCRQKGMSCSFLTNGMLMTPNLTKNLVKAGLAWFLITIDARDKEIYEKIRVGLNFETVRYNIKEAWKICRESNTKMHLGSVICQENLHDIENIKTCWRPYAHKYQAWLEEPFGKDRHSLSPHKGCYLRRAWTQLLIRVNGDVSFCCYDIDYKYTMGNIHEDTMLNIFNSSTFTQMRERVKLQRDLPEICKFTCFRETKKDKGGM